MIRITLAVTAPLLLLACASAPEDVKPRLNLADVTDDSLNVQFAVERAQRPDLPNGKKKPPIIGLVLSGGGTKAAVFSHGVLHGLHDRDILKEVDVISTTSGGGYAAYWYMSKLMEADRLRDTNEQFDVDQIFEDCFPSWLVASADDLQVRHAAAVGEANAALPGEPQVCANSNNLSNDDSDRFRWQAHLLRWPNVMDEHMTIIDGGSTQKAPRLAVFNLAIQSLLEGALGPLFTGDSAVALRYQKGIERAWGLNPNRRAAHYPGTASELAWKYSNSNLDGDGELHVGESTMPWSALASLYEKDKLKAPIWILNTNSGNKGQYPNMANLYELTPFWHGSYALAPQPYGPDTLNSVASGVRASAGFLDAQGIASDSQREALETGSRLLPALSWGVKVKHRPSDPKPLKLSDGGGSDNLALISAVRRGLHDIIVVDTAQDVEGSMSDLCWSKRALERESLTVDFEKELFDFNNVCKRLFDSNEKTKFAYNVADWKNPVIHGVVTWKDTGKTTDIWLIKAAWRQQDVQVKFNSDGHTCGRQPGEIDCLLLMFYGSDTKDVNTKSGYMTFPQHTTAGMTYRSSSMLTLAYRELGRMLAKNLRLTSDGYIARVGESSSVQPRCDLQPNSHPENLGEHSSKCVTHY